MTHWRFDVRGGLTDCINAAVPVEAPADIQIRMCSRDYFYLALANSGVSLIRSIQTLNRNVDENDLPDLSARVTVDAAVPGLLGVYEVAHSTPPVSETSVLR